MVVSLPISCGGDGNSIEYSFTSIRFGISNPLYQINDNKSIDNPYIVIYFIFYCLYSKVVTIPHNTVAMEGKMMDCCCNVSNVVANNEVRHTVRARANTYFC